MAKNAKLARSAMSAKTKYSNERKIPMTPVNKLSDSRDVSRMTEHEADAIFNELAQLEIQLTKIGADADKKVADITQKATDAMTPLKAQRAILELKLSQYITAHPQRFEKPRARKCPLGSYGMRTVVDLDVSEADVVIKFSNDYHLGLTKVTEKIV